MKCFISPFCSKQETNILQKRSIFSHIYRIQSRFASGLPNSRDYKNILNKISIQSFNEGTNRDEQRAFLFHPTWSEEQLKNVPITHLKPESLSDSLAYYTVKSLRFIMDFSTGYTLGKKLRLFKFSENLWLLRIIYLETVAGVPGMMFSMVRHLKSLRSMKRDHGWINTLLGEAENERVHLLVAINLYQPSRLFRYACIVTQFFYCNALFVAYLINPHFCHRFVGYLEEEAVKTYTELLQNIDEGMYPLFQKECSPIARAYWGMKPGATYREMFANMRADEGHHREVNHALAPLSVVPESVNPFRPQNDEFDI